MPSGNIATCWAHPSAVFASCVHVGPEEGDQGRAEQRLPGKQGPGSGGAARSERTAGGLSRSRLSPGGEPGELCWSQPATHTPLGQWGPPPPQAVAGLGAVLRATPPCRPRGVGPQGQETRSCGAPAGQHGPWSQPHLTAASGRGAEPDSSPCRQRPGAFGQTPPHLRPQGPSCELWGRRVREQRWTPSLLALCQLRKARLGKVEGLSEVTEPRSLTSTSAACRSQYSGPSGARRPWPHVAGGGNEAGQGRRRPRARRWRTASGVTWWLLPSARRDRVRGPRTHT